MMRHAEASPTAARRERTRHRVAHRSASSVRLLYLVSHHDRRQGDALPRRCSSRRRMPWRVSPYCTPAAIAIWVADLQTRVREALIRLAHAQRAPVSAASSRITSKCGAVLDHATAESTVTTPRVVLTSLGQPAAHFVPGEG
jgi:hypothetical protein